MRSPSVFWRGWSGHCQRATNGCSRGQQTVRHFQNQGQASRQTWLLFVVQGDARQRQEALSVTRRRIEALQRNCEILVPLHRNSPDQWKKILLLVHPTPTHPSNLLKVEGNNTKLADAARESKQEKQLVKAFSSWWSTMLPAVLAALLAAEC
jgi:hypothetical protein